MQWAMLLRQRIDEATSLLASVDGLCGLILAGSNGRGEAWPLSDVDMVLVYDTERRAEAAAEVERRASLLEDFWSCGVAGSLDLGALWFTASEAASAVAQGAPGLAARAGDDRWFHALDKAYAGRCCWPMTPSRSNWPRCLPRRASRRRSRGYGCLAGRRRPRRRWMPATRWRRAKR